MTATQSDYPGSASEGSTIPYIPQGYGSPWYDPTTGNWYVGPAENPQPYFLTPEELARLDAEWQQHLDFEQKTSNQWDKVQHSDWENFLHYAPPDDIATEYRTRRSIRTLAIMSGLIAAPALYAAYLKSTKKKEGLSESETMIGRSLEGVSQAATQLSLTALATPALSAALTYWLVEIGENYPRAKYDNDGTMLKPRGIYSGPFGDTIQTLLAVATAAPMVQGVAQLGSSFFARPRAARTARAGSSVPSSVTYSGYYG